jgi:hypothetical protein
MAETARAAHTAVCCREADPPTSKRSSLPETPHSRKGVLQQQAEQTTHTYDYQT